MCLIFTILLLFGQNIMFDERGSFSVSHPYPGPLAALLKSIGKVCVLIFSPFTVFFALQLLESFIFAGSKPSCSYWRNHPCQGEKGKTLSMGLLVLTVLYNLLLHHACLSF